MTCPRCGHAAAVHQDETRRPLLAGAGRTTVTRCAHGHCPCTATRTDPAT